MPPFFYALSSFFFRVPIYRALFIYMPLSLHCGRSKRLSMLSGSLIPCRLYMLLYGFI